MTRSHFSQLFPDLRTGGEHFTDPALRAWIDQRRNAAAAHELAAASFPGARPEIAQQLRAAFSASAAVFAPLRVTPPPPEVFHTAGVSWAGFGKFIDAVSDPATGADPERFLFVVTPHGLGLEAWKRLFDGAVKLSIATDIAEHFDIVDSPPTGVVSPATRSVGHVNKLLWTVRAVSTAAAPEFRNVSGRKHPTVSLPEMLTVQLLAQRAGAELLDPHSFTWLSGVFSHGRLAPRHTFDTSTATIRVSSRAVGNQAPHMGARLSYPN